MIPFWHKFLDRLYIIVLAAGAVYWAGRYDTSASARVELLSASTNAAIKQIQSDEQTAFRQLVDMINQRAAVAPGTTPQLTVPVTPGATSPTTTQP